MSSVFFNGQKLTTPTSASAVNDDAMQPVATTVGNAVAFVGLATGGQPKTVLSFGTPEEAAATLRSGEMLDAITNAFNPSDDTGAPATIIGVVVNPLVPATLSLLDATGATVVNVTSVNYGNTDNLDQLKVEDGTDEGKAISFKFQSVSIYQDDVTRQAFSIQYTGSASAATLGITGTGITLTAGTDVETALFSDYATMGDLVDKINSLSGYSASVLDNNDDLPTANALDYVTNQDVLTAPYTVRADLQAIVDYLNDGTSNYLSATRPDGAGTLPVNIDYTYLSGGSDGVTTTADWSAALTALRTADIQWLTAISGNPAIIAMTDTHAMFCSTNLKKERRAICGTVVGTTDVEAIAQAKAINSKRTSLCHIGVYAYNVAGTLVLKPPYMSAALISAMFAGSTVGTPMTNKTLRVQGVERNLENPTDTDILLEGGVLPIENTTSGYKVVQSITTWLGDQKYDNTEQSCGAATDYTVRSVREALDVLRGNKTSPLLLARGLTITQTTLAALAVPEPKGPGILVGDDNSPAYQNIQGSVNGDWLDIQYQASPVVPDNYVTSTASIQPYSGSSTLASTAN